MRSTSMILGVILFTFLLLTGCSGDPGNSIIPGADGLKSPLDRIRVSNVELDDIRFNGESVISSAYINLPPGKDVFPLEVVSGKSGEIVVSITDGLLRLPNGSRVDSYEGPIVPLKVEPTIDKGLVELTITYKGEAEHTRRYWLAVDMADSRPIPPYEVTTVITPEGDEIEVVADEMLVGLHHPTPLEDFKILLKALDMQILERIIDSDIYRLGIPPGMNPFEAIRLIEDSPMVEYAEPNGVLYPCITPNDYFWSEKWDLKKIECPDGWDIYKGDPELIIGIIDTGIDRDHPDLAARVVDGEDFIIGGDGLGGETPGDGEDNNDNGMTDENVGHGTRCAGIAGAVTNNHTGTAGVDWKCRLMGLRIFPVDGDTPAYNYALADAIIYAIDIPNVVALNVSLASPTYSSSVETAVSQAFAAGVIVVASAGNVNTTDNRYPACYDNVISVSGTITNDQKASFANYNVMVDVCAPATNIISTHFDDLYTIGSGTSSSAPMVTGLVSLVAGYYPSYTAQDIVDQILFTTDNIYIQNPGYVGMLGTGRINVYRALSEPLKPSYTMIGMEYFDDFDGITHGNSDGFFNPGEVIEISLTVRNDGKQDAEDTIGTLMIDDPYVHVIKDEVNFPDIPKAVTGTSSDMFVISIDGNCPDGYEVEYTFDFDDAQQSGPQEYEGTWHIYGNDYSIDTILLEPEDMPDDGEVFKGVDNQALVRIDVSGDINYGTIDELSIFKFGSVATETITEVRLYHDSDGNGIFDSGGLDRQLAVSDYYNQGYAGYFDSLDDPYSGHPNGPISTPHEPVTFNDGNQACFHGINLPATEENINSFFVVIDLGPDAGSETTLQIGIMNEASIKLRVPDIMDTDCFPVMTGEFTIVSPG